MPLVLFFSLAFTISVTLVINTGEVTSRKIQGQNATDAAAAAGGAMMARSLNYMAENNVTMAKIIAASAILDALERAVRDSLRQARIVKAIGLAMMAYPPTHKEGREIVTQIEAEKHRLLKLKGRLARVRERWSHENIWKALRNLSRLGDLLFYSAPLVAQHAAQDVYARNLYINDERFSALDHEGWFGVPPDSPQLKQDGQVWMVPWALRLPVCRKKWNDFAQKSTEYTGKWRKDVKKWALFVPFERPLVLSGFLWHFSRRLQEALDRLFADSGDSPPELDPVGTPADELHEEIEALQARQEEKEARRAALLRERAQLLHLLASAPLSEREARRQEIRSIEAQIHAVEQELAEIDRQIRQRFRQLASLLDPKRAPPEGAPPRTPASAATDLHPDIHPYLLRPSGFPGTFTYFAIGRRIAHKPMVPVVFNRKKHDEPVHTVAAVRLYNLRAADMWTPGWRVKLVRVREEDVLAQQRAVPATCGHPTDGETMDKLRASGLDMPPQDLMQQIDRYLRSPLVRH